MDPRTRTREKRPVFQSRFDLVKNRLIHQWLSNLITREIGLKQTPDNSQFQRLSSSPRKCKMPVRTCSYSNFEAFSSKLHPFIIVSNICHKKFHQFETITQIVLCFVTRRKFTDIKSRIFPRAIYIWNSYEIRRKVKSTSNQLIGPDNSNISAHAMRAAGSWHEHIVARSKPVQ